MPSYHTITLEQRGTIATLILNRPTVHNAFNDHMLAELIAAFSRLAGDFPSVRVVVLTGKGASFCAGADLNWMRKMIRFSYEENLKDARLVSDCMYRLYSLPQATIARVNGAAIGGGVGLVAACDFAIASQQAHFRLSEVRLGLVPACISPYVLKKMGEGRCREFFLTGEPLDATHAQLLGLVTEVVAAEELDQAVQRRVAKLLTNGSQAMAICKKLLEDVSTMPLPQTLEHTARVISQLRIGQEAQEGMAAFLEKRRPSWAGEA